MGELRGGSGYNGVTGAKATYSDAEGMWIDANGERIRPDAIVGGDPPAPAAPVATAAAPAAAAPSSPEVASSAPAMPSALGALGQAASGAGYQEGTPGALNPKLGSRLDTSALAALASLAGRNY